MREELKQLMDMGTFEAADYDKLNWNEKKHAIPSHMFLRTSGSQMDVSTNSKQGS